MRYEVDKDTLAVKVYDDLNNQPFLFQPDFPDGTAFADLDEAEKFAKAIISHHENQTDFPISRAILHKVEEVND